ncbi:MAG: Panacea domain-containing protein, partial [Dongiaceae bacterium]
MPYDARAVANCLLDYADSKSSEITLLTLMKVIYFAHGWHLARFGQPLVTNHFEAWERGPVVRVLYDEFKDRRARPIT